MTSTELQNAPAPHNDCDAWHQDPDGHCVKLNSVELRLHDGDARMQRIEDRVTRIEVKLDANTAATDEILEIITAAKSFFRFAERAGTVIKWVAGVLAPVLAVWYTIHNGRPPTP